jgi:hypothetical protein
MSRDRRKARREFRPELEGQRLEPRVVLSSAKHTPFVINQYILTHPQPGVAKAFGRPKQYQGSRAIVPHGPTYNKGYVATQTTHGGSQVIVAAPDGSRFRISLVYADNLSDGGLAAETGSSTTAAPNPTNQLYPTSVAPQPTGTVRAYAMPGGKVGIIVDGSTEQMQLNIDPLAFAQRKGYAHSFAYGEAGRSHILNIGSLNITSGKIQAILGFHSADLSGPLVIGGSGRVDRLAFNSLQPGAAIGIGGTLDTLDINGDVNLTSGPGIRIGQDLNLFNAGGNVTLANGASVIVGRFIGAQPQPAKGTGTGSNILSLNQTLVGTGTAQIIPSVSGNIQGDFTVGPGSVFAAFSGIANSSISGAVTGGSPSPFLINGALNLFSNAQLVIPNAQIGTTFITFVTGPNPDPPPMTIITPVQNNLVALNGVHVATP